MKNYRFFTTADVIQQPNVIEFEKFRKTVLASDATEEEKLISQIPVDVDSWLTQAAKTYHISKDLNDYVIVPVSIFYSELPNRNGIAFPLSQLIRFNPETGQLGYQSWKAKPTFYEHQNDVLEEAKGVIFDSVLLPAPQFKGNLYKVTCLLGFDKTKDPILANDILTKKRTCYSMGAYCEDYKCSICGARVSKGGCNHVSVNYPEMKIIDGQLAFLKVEDIVGFETSSVATPAFLVAENDKVLDIAKV